MTEPATICFIDAAQRNAVNEIFVAIGFGPMFRRPVTTENPATFTSIPSSWFFAESVPDPGSVAMYQAMADAIEQTVGY